MMVKMIRMIDTVNCPMTMKTLSGNGPLRADTAKYL